MIVDNPNARSQLAQEIEIFEQIELNHNIEMVRAAVRYHQGREIEASSSTKPTAKRGRKPGPKRQCVKESDSGSVGDSTEEIVTKYLEELKMARNNQGAQKSKREEQTLVSILLAFCLSLLFFY